MGLFSRIAAPRVERAVSAQPAYSGLMAGLGGVQSATGLIISPATAMAVSTVYACVRRRAQDAARCPGSLYTITEEGQRIEIEDHPLVRLFKRPNRVQTWLEFAEQMNVALLLRQNAYAAVLRDSRGDPAELIPLNPDSVSVLEAVDGQLFYQVSKLGLWQMAVLRGFDDAAVPAEDVLHIRGLTFNTLVGVSTLGLGRDAIGLAMGQEQQAARWMQNGARPSGVLESDKPLSEEAAKRLKDRWESFKAGIQNVGTTAVLEDGIKWKEMKLTSHDLEFLNARQFQVPEICRFLGVPPHKVFYMDRAAAMSISQQDQDYVNSTVAPDIERWEQKLEQYFGLTDEGFHVHFDEGQLLRADVMTRFQSLRMGVLTGILTPNEARTAEGLPPLPGGDNLLVPANTASLGSDMTGTAPDGAGRPEEGTLPQAGVPTNGKQPNADENDANPELPGAEELQPRAMMLGVGVPQRHMGRVRVRRRAPELTYKSTTHDQARPERAFSLPEAPAASRDPQPLALTVNVDASKPSVRRVIRKNEDGSLEITEVPANDDSAGDAA